ncbi:MAG: LuxR C-terminal-related transcriptional regulator [Thermodesulfobacteriota bacterium]
MNTLSKAEMMTLLEIIADCVNCESLGRFSEIALKVGELLQSGNLVFLTSTKNFLSIPTSIREINVSYPTEWADIYRAQNFIEVDPVISLGQTGLLYWKDIFKQKPPDNEFYSQAKSFGLANGFSHIISNKKLFGLMSFAGKELANTSRSREMINHLAPHLHQLALHLTHKRTKENIPQLTPREREVLLWAMEGKSNWEISVILGISQESIKGHIANILHKLDASNRTHAVAIALQYNLLSPFGLAG